MFLGSNPSESRRSSPSLPQARMRTDRVYRMRIPVLICVPGLHQSGNQHLMRTKLGDIKVGVHGRTQTDLGGQSFVVTNHVGMIGVTTFRFVGYLSVPYRAPVACLSVGYAVPCAQSVMWPSHPTGVRCRPVSISCGIGMLGMRSPGQHKRSVHACLKIPVCGAWPPWPRREP